MNSIEHITNIVKEKSTREQRTVKGLWDVRCLYNPQGNGRVFDYRFLISQTIGQGCAYSIVKNYDAEYLKSIIGKDFLDCNIKDSSLMVSLLDSVYGEICPLLCTYEETKDGHSEEKMAWRTDIILNEAKILLPGSKAKKVLNIGVVGDFIKAFSQAGYDTSGSDFDVSIVNTKLFDTAYIHHGEDTINALKGMDLAIITGMAITTNTIDEILNYCQKNSIATIVFAETGANLAGYYINKGIDCYVSEEFPFYIFNGKSTIKIYRRNR